MNLCQSILVVEDNADIREAIVEVLSSEGYQVTSAPDGKQALEKLPEMKVPTLILLDLMMPVMNGWEFLDSKAMDERFDTHQVVTISAVPSTASLEDATPLETSGSIQKPMSFERLFETVKKFCGEPKAAGPEVTEPVALSA